MNRRYIPEIKLQESNTSSKNKIDFLYNELYKAIKKDALQHPGATIVSERKLSENLGINRLLVHKAYERLVEDHILERHKSGRRLMIPVGKWNKCIPCIGIILPFQFSKYIADHNTRLLRQTYYTGIVDQATALGMGIMILHLPPTETPQREVKTYIEDKIAPLYGLIHLGGVSSNHKEDKVLTEIFNYNRIPQVFIGGEADNFNVGSVTYDSNSGMKIVSNHLLDLGHHDLGVIAPDYGKEIGYKYEIPEPPHILDIFRKSGLTVKDEWVFKTEGEIPGKKVEEAVKELLTMQNRPSAIWCGNDRTAAKVIEELKKANCEIPNDFSIIGMDNVNLARDCTPKLTTLQKPMYACGKSAVLMLEEHTKNGINEANRVKKFPMTLHSRESVTHNRFSKQIFI